MQIVVCCNEEQKQELTATGLNEQARVIWVFEKVDLLHYTSTDAVIDLLYENNKVNNGLLHQMSGVRIINSVSDTLPDTDLSFVRINGWTTFLNAPTLEGSCGHEDLKKFTESVFTSFNKTLEWLPDEPGFVVPRVVSLIINEAFFAVAEGVSTRDEIDTAMKLGTAYPFGPFEWSKKIGLKNIAGLLQTLSKQQSRYTPAPLLLSEAGVI